MSISVRPHRQQPTRVPCPWDSPSKITGVGCHFLLQCMKVKSESEVTQLCPTLSDPMDWSPPGSSVHVIFQARVLEWGAIAFSTKNLGLVIFSPKVIFAVKGVLFFFPPLALSLFSLDFIFSKVEKFIFLLPYKFKWRKCFSPYFSIYHLNLGRVWTQCVKIHVYHIA